MSACIEERKGVMVGKGEGNQVTERESGEGSLRKMLLGEDKRGSAVNPSSLHTTHNDCECSRGVQSDARGVFKLRICSDAIVEPRHTRLTRED